MTILSVGLFNKVHGFHRSCERREKELVPYKRKAIWAILDGFAKAMMYWMT